MAADTATVATVLTLQAQIDQAEAAFNQFAGQMDTIFSNMEKTVSGHFDNIDKRATQTADHFKKEGDRAGHGFAAGLAVVASAIGATFVISLRDSVRSITELAVNLGTLSTVTGSTRGQIQQFQYALGQLGIPSQHVQLMLVQLQARVAALGTTANSTARGPLHQLGLSVKDLAGKDAISQIEILADKIKNLNPQSQVAVTRELFGFRGAPLVGLLSQGSEGVKRMMEAFKPIPDDVLDSFVRLDMSTKALQATWQAFNASMLQPAIDAFTNLVNKATDFVNKLRNMSKETKMEVLVGLIALSAVAFQDLTVAVGSFFAKSLAMRTVVTILEDFAIPLQIIAALVVAGAAAWSSNWGNVRGIVGTLLATIMSFVNSVRSMLMQLWQIVGPILVRAWQDLSRAVGNAGVEFGRMLNALINNRLVLSLLAAVILAVVGIIYVIVEAIVAFVQMLTMAELGVRVVADVLNGIFVTAIAVSLDALGHLVDGFIDAANVVPGFADAVGNAALQMSAKIKLAAQLAHKDVKATDEDLKRSYGDLVAMAQGKGLAGTKITPWKFPGGKAVPKTPSGEETLTPDTGKAKDTTSTWLENLRNKLAEFEGKVKDADFQVKSLAGHIKLLGEIDSYDKLQEALSFVRQEAAADGVEIKKNTEYLKQLAIAQHEVKAKEAATSDPKDKANLQREYNELHTQELSALGKNLELRIAIVDKIKEAYDIQKKYWDEIGGDEFKSYAERQAAYESSAAAAPTAALRDAAFKEFNTTVVAAADAAKNLADAQIKYQEALTKAREEAAKTPGAGGRDAAAILDAQEALVTAEEQLTAAHRYAAAMSNNFANVVTEGATPGMQAYDAAQQALITANTQEITASTNLAAAHRALYEAENAVTLSMLAEFNKLAQQVGGPVYQALAGLYNYIKGNFSLAATNLTQAFIEIFQKTLAYKDVQVAVMEITGALAKILNALRPVLDFFLGVIIGITNIFIAMYDVIATLLDVLGLNIQKIKLLNDDLQNLNTASAPLIQIVHDLPTLNEFNAGVWGQLVAQQTAANNSLNNLNSDILQGFDKTMSKLGEIVGILIAIKFLLGVFGVNLLGSNNSFFGGIFNWFKNLFGMGGGAAAPGSPGDWSGNIGQGEGLTNYADTTQQAVQQGVTDALNSGDITQPLVTEDQAVQNILDASNSLQEQTLQAGTEQAAEAAAQTPIQTAHAASGFTLPPLLGKVVSGLADLYGIWTGFQEGGPMGGIQAGFSADSLALLLGATGPVGIAVGVGVGLLSMLLGGKGLFGPNPANEPDIYQQQAWGSANANMWGAGVGQFANNPMMANGQAFSMNPNLASATGGLGLLQFIAQFEQSMGGSFTKVLGPLANIFEGLSTTSTDIIGGKNGILDLMNGVQMNWQQLYSDSMTAFKEIEAYMSKATTGASLFSNAMNVDLANVYGLGSASRWNRGMGGSGGGESSAATNTAPVLQVSFGDLYGLDQETVRNKLQPIFDEFLARYQQQMVLNTRANAYAYSRGLS